MFEIEGRLGFFQVVDERGCVLALFSPPDDDMESNRLRQTVKPEARLIWCFLDEQDVNASSESKNPFVGRASEPSGKTLLRGSFSATSVAPI